MGIGKLRGYTPATYDAKTFLWGIVVLLALGGLPALAFTASHSPPLSIAALKICPLPEVSSLPTDMSFPWASKPELSFIPSALPPHNPITTPITNLPRLPSSFQTPHFSAHELLSRFGLSQTEIAVLAKNPELFNSPAVNTNFEQSADQNPVFYVDMSAPPKGFEQLDGPQNGLVDVYYQGELLKSVPAQYTADAITIEAPEQLVAAMANIRDKAATIKALSRKMPTHSNLVCTKKQPIPVCQEPVLTDAAVVFDINIFRLDIFVSPKYVTPSTAQDAFLPPSNAGLSFANNTAITTAGAINDQNNYQYQILNQGSLAEGSGRINYALSYANLLVNDSANTGADNNQGKPQLAALNAQWDHRGYTARAGYIETRGTNTFIGNQNIFGVSMGTTLNTLKQDHRTIFGSPIVLLLSMPSQVNIFRNGRLLASGNYPAGQQEIDTNALPEGAYPITIQIRDALGNLQEQQRFFDKTQQIPPKGYPVYYADLGFLTGAAQGQQGNQVGAFLPQVSSTPIYQVGLNKRVKDNWGVSGGLMGDISHHFLTGGFFFLLPYHELQIQPQYLATSTGNYGVAINSNAVFGRVNVGLSASELRGHLENPALNNVATTGVNVFNPLTNTRSQFTANIGFPIKQTTVILLAQNTKAIAQPAVYSYGVTSRTLLHRFKYSTLELNVSGVYSASDPLLVTATLNWNFNKDKLGANLLAGYQTSRVSENSASTGAGAIWRNLDVAQRGLSIGANINQTQNIQILTSTIDDLNTYTHLTGQIQRTEQINTPFGSSGNTAYTGTLDTRLVWAKGQGWPKFGAGFMQNAGAVIYVDSDKPGEDFEISAGNQAVQIVKTNAATPIFLSPYQIYSIKIKDASSNYFNYDERPQQLVLYPGNFKYFTWKARQKFIVFTQILMPDHKPVANAAVKADNQFNYTDDQGNIQLEVLSDTRVVEFQISETQKCQVQLPEKLPVDHGVANISTLLCVPAPSETAKESKGETNANP